MSAEGLSDAHYIYGLEMVGVTGGVLWWLSVRENNPRVVTPEINIDCGSEGI